MVNGSISVTVFFSALNEGLCSDAYTLQTVALFDCHEMMMFAVFQLNLSADTQ